MQEVGHWLQSLELGAAIHFGSLSMVPLRAAGGADAGYLTLADALASRHARVTEVSDYGSVPELAFDNLSSEHDVLLLDILRYGADVKVLEPPELRDRVRAELLRASQQYA